MRSNLPRSTQARQGRAPVCVRRRSRRQGGGVTGAAQQQASHPRKPAGSGAVGVPGRRRVAPRPSRGAGRCRAGPAGRTSRSRGARRRRGTLGGSLPCRSCGPCPPPSAPSRLRRPSVPIPGPDGSGALPIRANIARWGGFLSGIVATIAQLIGFSGRGEWIRTTDGRRVAQAGGSRVRRVSTQRPDSRARFPRAPWGPSGARRRATGVPAGRPRTSEPKGVRGASVPRRFRLPADARVPAAAACLWSIVCIKSPNGGSSAAAGSDGRREC